MLTVNVTDRLWCCFTDTKMFSEILISHLHWLWKLRSLVVDISHSDADCRCSCARHRPFIHSHYHELIQMVRSLIVQGCSRENSSMRRNTEVLTQGVEGQLRIFFWVAVSSWYYEWKTKQRKTWNNAPTLPPWTKNIQHQQSQIFISLFIYWEFRGHAKKNLKLQIPSKWPPCYWGGFNFSLKRFDTWLMSKHAHPVQSRAVYI